LDPSDKLFVEIGKMIGENETLTLTPLHVASMCNNLQVLKLLLNECKSNNVSAYIIEDSRFVPTPLFCCETSDALEMFLQAGFKNLQLVRRDGKPLIHFCIEKHML
jgi:hypothetical protein